MTDQYLASMLDSTRSISYESGTLLTTSAINALHFPGLSTSGISDTGGGNRRASLLFDTIGMCDSMTESFCSNSGQDDPMVTQNPNALPADPSVVNGFKMDRKDSTAQRKRRSRKSQFDGVLDGPSLDKIEAVTLADEQNEPDDVWLFEVPKHEHKEDSAKDNIFSWVHKEFKTNDINTSKHRLLCKLDDMSHARTIRSVSCHNFADNQRLDNVKKNGTEQQVHSEPLKNGRLSSPLRTSAVNIRPATSVNVSPLHSTIATTKAAENGNGTVADLGNSRDSEKEPPMDYTDLEVITKLQLENLRQAERQGPLSKRFGGSNASLASTNSVTSAPATVRSGTKPPVAPKPTVTRNGTRLSTYTRSNTQTISTTKPNGNDLPTTTEPKLVTARTSLLPPNSANNVRTRPPTARPIQAYRGSQTSYLANAKVPPAPSSVQRNGKKPATDFSSTYTTKALPSNGNGLLNDVSNKPLTEPVRSQVGPQRRTVLPQSSTYTSVDQLPSTSSVNPPPSRPVTVTRSSSSLSQGRRSNIPTVGKPQRPSTATVARTAPSQSSNSLMVTQAIRSIGASQLSDSVSSWNDGCY